MIKRRLLSYDISQLTKAFKKDFPQLVTMAEESESAALFKEALRSFVSSRIDRTVGGSNMGNVVAKRIFLLIEHDGMSFRQVRRYQYGRLPACGSSWPGSWRKMFRRTSLSTCTGNSNCWRSRRKSFRTVRLSNGR